MHEKRKHERTLTLKTADILFDTLGNGCECAIVDISDGGACLLVESTAALPDEFDLTAHRDGLTRRCCVAWRNTHKIGVSFIGEPRFAWLVHQPEPDPRSAPATTRKGGPFSRGA